MVVCIGQRGVNILAIEGLEGEDPGRLGGNVVCEGSLYLHIAGWCE